MKIMRDDAFDRTVTSIPNELLFRTIISTVQGVEVQKYVVVLGMGFKSIKRTSFLIISNY